MLVRLKRSKRLRAGRLVALVYLLCVLAPTLSFALPGSKAVSPCLADAEHVPGMMHVHVASHVDADEHMHGHAMAHTHVASPDQAASVQAPTVPEQTPSKGSHSSDGNCCGLMCLSALPATLVEVATPSVPRASTEVDRNREVAESGPSERYRPPIA
jgi:hypothetical protein